MKIESGDSKFAIRKLKFDCRNVTFEVVTREFELEYLKLEILNQKVETCEILNLNLET